MLEPLIYDLSRSGETGSKKQKNSMLRSDYGTEGYGVLTLRTWPGSASVLYGFNI